jgi:hypothetical protein
MGERVDAIFTIGSSAPLIAAAEGKEGHALLSLRVAGVPGNVDVDAFVKTLRTSEVLNTAALKPAPEVVLPQRDPDTILDLRLAGPLDGYKWPINGKPYDPPQQRACRRGGQTGAVALRQRVDDVSPNALARAHVPGGAA